MAQFGGRGTPDSPGGAAVHEHATRVPAPEEYEHGRLAGVALRLAGAPVLSRAPPCPRHLWLAS
jgi:hypothetical protein